MSHKLKVRVTREHLGTFQQPWSMECPIARAIKEQHPELRHVSVGITSVETTDATGGRRVYRLPPAAIELRRMIDGAMIPGSAACERAELDAFTSLEFELI